MLNATPVTFTLFIRYFLSSSRRRSIFHRLTTFFLTWSTSFLNGTPSLLPLLMALRADFMLRTSWLRLGWYLFIQVTPYSFFRSLRIEFSSRPLFLMTSAFLMLRLAATTFLFVGLGGGGGGLGLGLARLFRTLWIFLHRSNFVSFSPGLILRIAAIRRSSSFFKSVHILRPTLKVLPLPESLTFLFLFLNDTFFLLERFLILVRISSLVAALEPSLVFTLKLTTPLRLASAMSSAFDMRAFSFDFLFGGVVTFLFFFGFTPSSKTPVTKT